MTQRAHQHQKSTTQQLKSAPRPKITNSIPQTPPKALRTPISPSPIKGSPNFAKQAQKTREILANSEMEIEIPSKQTQKSQGTKRPAPAHTKTHSSKRKMADN